MKQTVYFEQFYSDVNADKMFWRGQDLKSNFSYEGAKALYEYLEDLEESTGQSMDYDFIAIRCEYTEYENLEELQENYTSIKSLDHLREYTTVIEVEDSEKIVIEDY